MPRIELAMPQFIDDGLNSFVLALAVRYEAYTRNKVKDEKTARNRSYRLARIEEPRRNSTNKSTNYVRHISNPPTNSGNTSEV
jgi:hypothetical protein